jgi:hypothetical protein
VVVDLSKSAMELQETISAESSLAARSAIRASPVSSRFCPVWQE